MTKLQNQLITPHSLVIEKTALELAACFFEAGRSSGLTSKHKHAKSFAKANVKIFIPKAVDLLMDILGNPNTPEDQRQMIYDSFMERSNDKELSNIGIKVFENNTPFIPDFKKPTDLDLQLDKSLKDMFNGQKAKQS